ncbi:MAG: VOC family protein [Xanthobacteraceae bacterium]|nr:VOC family protein [Xanthobacteraceae bacterium]
MLATPGFHHLHLNSVNPDAAIDFYLKQFPGTSKTTWAGIPALKSPTNVLILFSKVDTPPPTSPQTAIWHFGWHVQDSRRRLDTYKARPDVQHFPLYTSDDGGTVLISSDTWPAGAALGLTRAEIADAKSKNVQPARERGFAYLQGPDGAIVEYLGNFPAERMNHVHMFQDHPFCAELWYRRHLDAHPVAGRSSAAAMTEANCQVPRGPEPSWPAMERHGLYRTPRAAVEFDDVMLTWYARQDDAPLIGTRGQLYDHIALSVSDLDAWIDKLHGEGVMFLEQPYRLGDTRAAMIEGPSREAIELVEI